MDARQKSMNEINFQLEYLAELGGELCLLRYANFQSFCFRPRFSTRTFFLHDGQVVKLDTSSLRQILLPVASATISARLQTVGQIKE